MHVHVHIWTDNTACLSWILTNRALHPIHSFLLQVLTFIKLTYNITVTMGHKPGVVNVYADAASRKFGPEVLNGLALRLEMEALPLLPFSAELVQSINSFATTPSTITSTLVHAALIALDGVRGWISA